MDLPNAKKVEIVIRDDGKSLWMHVDGKHVLRAGEIEELVIVDQRQQRRAAQIDPDPNTDELVATLRDLIAECEPEGHDSTDEGCGLCESIRDAKIVIAAVLARQA